MKNLIYLFLFLGMFYASCSKQQTSAQESVPPTSFEGVPPELESPDIEDYVRACIAQFPKDYPYRRIVKDFIKKYHKFYGYRYPDYETFLRAFYNQFKYLLDLPDTFEEFERDYDVRTGGHIYAPIFPTTNDSFLPIVEAFDARAYVAQFPEETQYHKLTDKYIEMYYRLCGERYMGFAYHLTMSYKDLNEMLKLDDCFVQFALNYYKSKSDYERRQKANLE